MKLADINESCIPHHVQSFLWWALL